MGAPRTPKGLRPKSNSSPLPAPWFPESLSAHSKARVTPPPQPRPRGPDRQGLPRSAWPSLVTSVPAHPLLSQDRGGSLPPGSSGLSPTWDVLAPHTGSKCPHSPGRWARPLGGPGSVTLCSPCPRLTPAWGSRAGEWPEGVGAGRPAWIRASRPQRPVRTGGASVALTSLAPVASRRGTPPQPWGGALMRVSRGLRPPPPSIPPVSRPQRAPLLT